MGGAIFSPVTSGMGVSGVPSHMSRPRSSGRGSGPVKGTPGVIARTAWATGDEGMSVTDLVNLARTPSRLCSAAVSTKGITFRRRNGENVARIKVTAPVIDRKSTRLNSSHLGISYAVFCLKKKKKQY